MPTTIPTTCIVKVKKGLHFLNFADWLLAFAENADVKNDWGCHICPHPTIVPRTFSKEPNIFPGKKKPQNLPTGCLEV